jgi:hypothetical protein
MNNDSKSYRSTRLFGFVVLIALLSVCLLLGGCTPKYIYVTQTRYEMVRLPIETTENCSITTPPAKGSYLALADEEKENSLANYNVALIGDLAKCNAQWEIVRKKQDENATLVEKRNKDLKPDGK